MDSSVDISSYIQRESSNNARRSQPVQKSAMRSTRPTRTSNPDRRNVSFERQKQPELKREAVIKPPVVTTSQRIPRERRLSNIPLSSASSSRTVSSITSTNQTLGIRSRDSSFVPQETRSDELSRLRIAFDNFRKDCNTKIESVMATNASLMEDLCDLKHQLDLATTKLTERNSYTRRDSSMKSIDTDKLMNDLSAKLLECPEFKQKVVELVEERERDIKEEEEEEELDDKLLKPPVQSSPFRKNLSFSNEQQIQKFSSPKPIFRPTVIRDESFVQRNNYEEEEDYVELIDDAASPLHLNHNYDRYDRDNAYIGSPKVNLSFDYRKNQQLNFEEEEENLNQTFVIPSDSDDEERNNENSPVVKNRPVIDGFVQYSTKSKDSPIRNRKSTSWATR